MQKKRFIIDPFGQPHPTCSDIYDYRPWLWMAEWIKNKYYMTNLFSTLNFMQLI